LKVTELERKMEDKFTVLSANAGPNEETSNIHPDSNFG
jgi:hypothetical protein